MYEKIIELLQQKKYHELKSMLADMNEADIASVLSELPQELLPLVYRILPKELAADGVGRPGISYKGVQRY